eukprot:Selendium_serpulae@DN5386_c0_g1_i4.p1
MGSTGTQQFANGQVMGSHLGSDACGGLYMPSGSPAGRGMPRAAPPPALDVSEHLVARVFVGLNVGVGRRGTPLAEAHLRLRVVTLGPPDIATLYRRDRGIGGANVGGPDKHLVVDSSSILNMGATEPTNVSSKAISDAEAMKIALLWPAADIDRRSGNILVLRWAAEKMALLLRRASDIMTHFAATGDLAITVTEILRNCAAWDDIYRRLTVLE